MERIGGLSAVRDAVKSRLGHEAHATSTQVEREWNRIVLGAVATMLNAFEHGARDWTDVTARLREGFGRTGTRNWQVADWIRGDDNDLATIRARAEDYRRIRARAEFRAIADPVRDGTCCGIAGRPIVERYGRWHHRNTCTKDERICEQPAFFQRNDERARRAAQALIGSSREPDRAMGVTALRALESNASAATKGKACYGSNGLGGDIAIALECASGETLLTTDASFDLICPAIGVSHERLQRSNPSTELEQPR